MAERIMMENTNRNNAYGKLFVIPQDPVDREFLLAVDRRTRSDVERIYGILIDYDWQANTIANAVIESDNENGLKILENLDADDESIVTDASNKGEDEEIVDYSNYQPTETKEEDIEADDKDSLVDEDKIYNNK